MRFARTRKPGAKGYVAFLLTAIVGIVLVPTNQAASMQAAGVDVSTRAGAYGFRPAEVCFMKRINRTRQRAGLGPLRWDKQMGYVARRHANQMAGSRAVYHDANMGNEITRWRNLAQNTGGGRNCKSLHRSFMQSPSHRANILGQWRFIGVGIEYSGSKIYVQQIFENRRDPGNVYHWP